MLEKEIKLMLSEEEYLRLKEGLDLDGEVSQVNHYYYSAECAVRRISVRVREVEGKALLQIKLPVSTEGSLAVREEIERILPQQIGPILERMGDLRADLSVRIPDQKERAAAYRKILAALIESGNDLTDEEIERIIE